MAFLSQTKTSGHFSTLVLHDNAGKVMMASVP